MGTAEQDLANYERECARFEAAQHALGQYVDQQIIGKTLAELLDDVTASECERIHEVLRDIAARELGELTKEPPGDR